MRLSEYVIKDGDLLVKDCEFDCLGLATETIPNKKIVCFCLNAKYLDNIINNPSVFGFITTKKIYDQADIPERFGVVISDNPKCFYYTTHNIIAKKHNYKITKPTFIDKSAIIHPTAVVAKNNVYIGKNTIIEPNTVINEFVTIKDNVKIGPNNVIGGPAFQFYRDGDNVINVVSMGELIIERNVETQSSCSIDNSIFKTARIGENTKIDNYAQIAHDFICGQRCLIMAHAVISGRVTMGDDVYIAPSVTIVNGLKIGTKSKASIGAVVTKNIEDGQQVSGNFAIPHKKLIEHVKNLAK